MVTTKDHSGLEKDDAAPQPEEFEVLLLSCSEETGYAVFVPALPGCASQGEDWDEALDMVEDAIELFLEVAERPQVDVATETEQIKRDWEPQGYLVGAAKVWVNCDAGSD